MIFRSTRSSTPSVDFVGALVGGLAPDGGLYVPDAIPALPGDWATFGYRESVAASLSLFGAEGVESLVAAAAARFDHPEIAPIVEVGDRLVMELFWGPTLSFKDHAMQVVGRLLDRHVGSGTILGATSGDTGSAGIEGVRGTDLDIVILYPDGMVSDFQRRQMTTVADPNVKAVAVDGTFDDCQALVKDAFSRHELLAVNSINFARVAAQVGYYIYAGARIGEPFDVVVPTGNFGNVYSCWLAKQMGVPIEVITIANNANHALADVVTTGVMTAAEVVATLAPSMDVQIPSNFERFTEDPTAEFETGWSTDEQIMETIDDVRDAFGYLLDPHTATAWRAGSDTRSDRPQLVVATAHPAKFLDEAEPPDGYPDLSQLPERIHRIANDPSELEPFLR